MLTTGYHESSLKPNDETYKGLYENYEGGEVGLNLKL